jgi:hypothetical protein
LNFFKEKNKNLSLKEISKIKKKVSGLFSFLLLIRKQTRKFIGKKKAKEERNKKGDLLKLCYFVLKKEKKVIVSS